MANNSMKLAADIRRRALFLLEQNHTTVPINWGDGWQKRRDLTRPGWRIYISLDTGRGLKVNVLSEDHALMGEWNKQVTAFSESDISGSGGYINDKLITDIVLPAMRRAMILDDIATAGDHDGQPVADGEDRVRV